MKQNNLLETNKENIVIYKKGEVNILWCHTKMQFMYLAEIMEKIC